MRVFIRVSTLKNEEELFRVIIEEKTDCRIHGSSGKLEM